MVRLRNRINNFQIENFSQDQNFNLAYKRVKRIKGFYIHLLVYVFVNLFLIFRSFFDREFSFLEFWSWETFTTPIFWGIGILAHGISVFGPNVFFGSDWENRKMNEFMQNYKSEKWE